MDTTVYPAPHVVESTAPHTHTVIFLHGSSSCGKDFADSLGQVELTKFPLLNIFSRFPTFRWVFPSCKRIYSTQFRDKLNQWFDVYSLEDPSEKEHLQRPGLRESVAHLRPLLHDELVKVGGRATRMILAGYDQGAALALLLLLLQEPSNSFRGFIGYGGWMPFRGVLKDMTELTAAQEWLQNRLNSAPRVSAYISDPNAIYYDTHPTKVLLGHGQDDAVVDVSLAEEVKTILQGMKYEITTLRYVGAGGSGHWFKEPEALDEMATFIQAITHAYSPGVSLPESPL
ncbi:hypothetical protein Dda_6006 [Drechslerella dactyloides]|uniref:Phospholipase/carboxylesterase/thioesterase domain-containing protein n=1 Tax=Drechslerella dactyloides TaxID=74499 RepID=A0AAD6IUY0_DREDA|nr:hypothetical protein Dda_6006 [Drechslerella dactyloides]